MIENHQPLFDIEQSDIERKIESFATKDIESCFMTDDGCYVFNENPNYLFLIRHLAKHFGDNEYINIRQFVDFGLFINVKGKSLISIS